MPIGCCSYVCYHVCGRPATRGGTPGLIALILSWLVSVLGSGASGTPSSVTTFVDAASALGAVFSGTPGSAVISVAAGTAGVCGNTGGLVGIR